MLEELEEINGVYIAFVDDNLIGYTSSSKLRAIEIFEGMIDRNLNKKWHMQTSINAANDERVVELASRAGCMFANIGFETIDKSALKKMKKGVNLKLGVENYKNAIDVFHKHGIAVWGGFIIGNDYESQSYYESLADFMIKGNVDIVQTSILTPLPGTKLLEEMQNSNRLIYDNFPQDWDKYRFSYMVYKPGGSEAEEVYSGANYIKHHIYSFPTYQYRLVKSLMNLKNKTSFRATLKMNEAMKRAWKNSHYFKKYDKSFDTNEN